ncbi:hypothetical protein GA0115240_16253 [Streptomyces sp. DvalAA-14]|uniref:hypothetical protein n=1 Tax=unclassified Streptomyces TaxID=2593676 RepID=UPI00081B8507|nr:MULTISPECIES: hypothetical protein [unclassified Streptomyces]MYS24269.1 hypothetical protein [Streptomyces sp. SID4948]SCE44488.1 hypothetical protein GA0115240_16253 [Streptomyces sp. DvalAA-14]
MEVRAQHPVAFPLAPGGASSVVFLLPDAADLSDLEQAELRVARAALATEGIPERGAVDDIAAVARDTSVATLTTFLLTAGGTALRNRWSRHRGPVSATPAWGFEAAWAKVTLSAAATAPQGAGQPRLVSAAEEPADHEWRFECDLGSARFLARVDRDSPVVLWSRLPVAGPEHS